MSNRVDKEYDRVELYTCKFESTVTVKSAKIGIIVSAQRGTVEDVNELMNTIAQKLREIDNAS